MTQTPPGLDPLNTARRTFELEATAHTVGGMLKEGHVGEFTLMCDEGPRLGGEGSAPTPLQYLLVSLAF